MSVVDRASQPSRSAAAVRSRFGRSAHTGNQASLRRLQAKLTIGSVNDPLEQEADAAADRVMRMADPRISGSAPATISRKCRNCDKEEKKDPLQRKISGTDAAAETAPPIVDEVLSSPGRALDPTMQALMGSRFGADFSNVRIHTGPRAAQSAAAVKARAYTVGNTIVFGEGQFNPGGNAGRHLLAHELAHVVQQRGDPAPTARRAPPTGDSPPEGSKPEIERPQRVRYGETELSTEAIKWRRSHPDVSTDQNLIAFKFTWSKPGMEHAQTVIHFLPNEPGVAHSEKMMDQYLIDFKEKQGRGTSLVLNGIFSERQFCGGDQGCHTYLMNKFPHAKKEFAYNYQTEGKASYRRRGEKANTTRSVVAERIERFRDGGQNIDHSADKDPWPHFEDAGGRMKSAVRDPVKRPSEKRAEREAAERSSQAPTTQSASGHSADPSPTMQSGAAERTLPSAPGEPITAKPSTRQTSEGESSTTPERQTTRKTDTPKVKPDPSPPPRQTGHTQEAPKGKPAASKRPPSKPPGSSSSSESTAHPERSPKASKPAATEESGGTHGSTSTPHGSGSAEHIRQAATRALGNSLSQISGDLAKRAKANSQDPELTEVITRVEDAMEIENFLTDPKGFAATKIKGALIDGVFAHFRESLAKSKSDYVARFPEPTNFARDPLKEGVSLEQYRVEYERARLLYAAAVNDPWKRLRIVGAQLRSTHLPRLEGVNLIKEALQNQDRAQAEQRYRIARANYLAALQTVVDALADAKADLAGQSKDFGKSLWNRREVLDKISAECAEISNTIAQFATIPGFDFAYADFNDLAEGFAGLAGGFFDFATMVDGRKSLYELAYSNTKAVLERVDLTP